MLGNHEVAALREVGRVAGGEPPRKGFSWVQELTEEQVAWLRALPLCLRLPRENATVVHAGVVPGRPLATMTWDELTRMRDVVREGEDGRWEASESARRGSLGWAEAYEGEHGHVFFGHDARRRLQRRAHATGLDTGCLYGGALTAAVVTAGGCDGGLSVELVSVPASKVWVVPVVKKA